MSVETVFIMKKNVQNRSSSIISKLIKRYYRIIENMKRIEHNNYYIPCEKYFYMTSFYYYRYYPKEHITSYFTYAKEKLLYDSEIDIQKPDINQNNITKTRSQLFRLICRLSMEEIIYIGW